MTNSKMHLRRGSVGGSRIRVVETGQFGKKVNARLLVREDATGIAMSQSTKALTVAVFVRATDNDHQYC